MKSAKLNILFLVLLFTVNTSIAQRGKDGAKVISTSNVIVNEYTNLSTANVSAGATSINVINSTLNTNGRFPGNLAPGDLVFIIQMQGVTIDNGSTWWNWGYINNYNNCGYNELAEVLTVNTGTNTITFKCGLQNNYTASGKVQVIRVPRYTSLTVNANDTLTCDAWNGSNGGIVVVEVLGSTVVNATGAISATGKGFRGGDVAANSSEPSYGDYASTSYIYGGNKGESIAGWYTEYDSRDGRYGRGAPANGGGGGNAHNCGGGGGANGPNDNGYPYTGKGVPDVSNASWIAAWNLESGSFATSASCGGGRGGYSFSANNADALTVGPDNAAWGGTNRQNFGGFGGRTLEYANGKVYLGGGGGAGHQNNGWGGAGGNGGGIVYIHSYGSVSGTGTIISNGLNGKNSQGTVSAPWNYFSGVDGSGGGGGGGAIYINTIGNISGVTLRANGGKGGSQIKTRGAIYTGSNPEAEGPGGGGGGGSITTHGGSAIKDASGGANGICDPASLSAGDYAMGEFPPNGATKGANGYTTGWTGHFAIIADNDTVCQGGGNATLTATLTSGGWIPAGTTITWYDAQVGGNLVGTGNTLNITNPTSTVSYWVGTCPGTYRQEVKVVYVPFSYNAGLNVPICLGSSGQLSASGGTQYHWSPITGLSNPNIANPIVTVTTNTKYFCTISNAQGCVGIDSVWVLVTSINANAGSNKKICTGDSVSLTASGGASFLWNTGSSNATIKVSPPSSQFYYVTVTTGICTDSARVWVKVNPKPSFNLGPDTAFCQGSTYILNSGNPAMNHLWQDMSTNQTYNVTTLGQQTYYCRVTDTTNCSTTDTVRINVVPNKNATITQIPPICSYSNPVTLHAVDNGGVWSGTGITSPTAGTFNPATAGPGLHLVRYILSGMCGDKDSIYIKVNAPPVVNIGPDTSICFGTPYVLNAGNPTLNHLWQNSSTGQTYNVTTSGTYYCRVTDTTSCFAVDTAHIVVLPLKDATITSVAPVCSYVAPFNLQAAQTGGVWSGTGITNSSTGMFNPATAGQGIHLIKYIISGQCGDRDSIYVKVNLPPLVDLGNDTSICNGTNLVLDAGNPGMTYLWQNMSVAQTFTTNSGGIFYCKVTDTTGCYTTDTIHITGITPKDASITAVPPVCMNIAPFNLHAVDNGGVWSGNGITSSSSGLFNPSTAGEGNHLIKYIISGQCGDRDSLMLMVLPVPSINITANSETCLGKNNGEISLAITGGTPPYQVNWNSGQTSLVISSLIPGIYTATIKDSNNCTLIVTETLSASADLCYKPQVYIPNVFSPNDDGNNDVFYVRGEGIKSLTFLIYDRWGEKVFETTDPAQGWDGKYKGKPMPAEIYYYKAIIEFIDGSSKTLGGDVTLTR